MKYVVALAMMAALAGCTTTRNPEAASQVGDAPVSANTARRGTPEFCRQYGRQTSTNVYATNSDFGAEARAEQQANISGNEAYTRCLAGQTN